MRWRFRMRWREWLIVVAGAFVAIAVIGLGMAPGA
jgi:hypothetical protein